MGGGQPHQLRPDRPPEHLRPYVIEPSLGADRVTLAFLVDAYDEEVVDEAKNDVRTVLRLHPALAPFKCAILPLSKKLGDKAREIQTELSKYFMVDYDDAGSIGKRYRRQDEIGTPYCITVDFETVGDDKASPWTSRPWATTRPPRTTPSPSGTGIPWSRCACPSIS